MTLEDLIYQLRKRLIDALDKGDQKESSDLRITFDMILDASYEFENRELSMMLEDLVYSGQHGAMGVDFKARDAIPSDVTIKRVFSSQDK